MMNLAKSGQVTIFSNLCCIRNDTTYISSKPIEQNSDLVTEESQHQNRR